VFCTPPQAQLTGKHTAPAAGVHQHRSLKPLLDLRSQNLPNTVKPLELQAPAGLHQASTGLKGSLEAGARLVQPGPRGSRKPSNQTGVS
jgi:hypothetical protein